MRTHATTRTAKNARRRKRLTLLGVLVFLVVAALAGYAIAAPRGPTPTISSGPSGTTSATSARFAFTGARGDTFECALDGAAFAGCTSPKSYSGLGDGAHTFLVRERTRGGQTGDPVARGWTVDTQPPPTPQIAQHPPTYTNQTSATFGYTDAEAGVTYQCKVDGVAYRSCPNPVSWSGLRGNSDGWIVFYVIAVDAAGNTSHSATYAWKIDQIAPPRPQLVQTPANPSAATSATFAFLDRETSATFECALDGAAYAACTSPKDYTGLAANRHSFSVRAVDLAGNRSATADYSWRATPATTGQPFAISGGYGGLLYPGKTADLSLRIANPNGEAILVESIVVTIQPGSTKPGCGGPANLQITPSNVSAANPLTVPANGSVTLPSGSVSAPRVTMRNLATNQDACKGATFSFAYSGSSHS
ncbi:MAG TPA: hypothetical protein VFG31_04710 [Conexibacter sp.]|nr:hypothetical protein [Conexibacter sp.]